MLIFTQALEKNDRVNSANPPARSSPAVVAVVTALLLDCLPDPSLRDGLPSYRGKSAFERTRRLSADRTPTYHWRRWLDWPHAGHGVADATRFEKGQELVLLGDQGKVGDC